MAHKHVVADSDHEFLIDATTRQMDNQGSKKLYFIQGDINSERLTFKVPATIEGHDMSKCTSAQGGRVEIHFTNTSSTGVGKNERMTILDDLAPSAKDEGYLTCSWIVPYEATEFAGSLVFSLRFICLNGTTVEYAWNTAVYSAITIQKGLNNGDEDLVDYTDSLEQWVDTFQNAANNNHIYAITDDGSIEDLTEKIDTMQKEHKEYAEKFDTANSQLDSLIDEHETLANRIDNEVVTLAGEQRITGEKTFTQKPIGELGFMAKDGDFSATYGARNIITQKPDGSIRVFVFPEATGMLVVNSELNAAKTELNEDISDLQSQINTAIESGSSKFRIAAPKVVHDPTKIPTIQGKLVDERTSSFAYGMYIERTFSTNYNYCNMRIDGENSEWKSISSEYIELYSTAETVNGVLYKGVRYLAKFDNKTVTIKTEAYTNTSNHDDQGRYTSTTPLFNMTDDDVEKIIVEFFNVSDNSDSTDGDPVVISVSDLLTN